MKYKNHKAEHHTENLSLYQMDCMELLKQTPDDYYDLAIVDPPYNLARFKNGIGKNDRHTVKTKSTLWNNNAPTEEYFQELFRISKNQIIWGANNFTLPQTEYFLIWNKKQTVDNFAGAEYAWVSMGLKMPAKVFDYGIHKHNHTDKIHPTQKPTPLYEYILETYAEKGQKILDTHLGSMSIAIACHYYGVHLTGCELDEDYFKAGIQRVENETRQLTLF